MLLSNKGNVLVVVGYIQSSFSINTNNEVVWNSYDDKIYIEISSWE